MISHPLAFMRLPYDLLVALDSRMFHFWMQPVHYLVRLVHILAMAVFFGMDVLFDLSLMRRDYRAERAIVARLAFWWMHWLFAVTMVSGVLLFFYDPVHIGSRGYLSPKLLLMTLALVNAAICHNRLYIPALRGQAVSLTRARTGAGISLALWTGVIIMSCLNSEGVPKVFLRG
ncbi:hypothetical protein [Novacetimonas pomaceti]|uniref:DUF2214 domain-containing protein n=1 Tax=Novacetimonas pomaceti TaxID=2021998 RepID=A0A318Q7N9_9PROT|nr:hypothetical protein [Novacetimonas pomaceti]PYD49247.1 hypothetical protein C3920_00450 [Novacetimonas pomaceti]PYD75567.1 hypothetical protein CFR71_08225 [Novacetimonas pomaceti]